ncbi:hypothetical protein PIB30_036201 [Stylosanthes scabra]|uniref:Uncharacterized protein n=1 Tax=Stylosanthes scabra TaxID=79078 RepID=A0ABU6SEY3_9FABA|nr:hypothetical protein [Stylosanthes scabra]
MVGEPFSPTPFNLNGILGGYASIQEHHLLHFQLQHNPTTNNISTIIMEFLGEQDMTMNNSNNNHNHNPIPQQHDHKQDDFKFDNLVLEEDFTFYPDPQKTQPPLLLPQKHVAPSPRPPPSLASSWELLSNYGSRFQRLRRSSAGAEAKTTTAGIGPKKLSTEEIVRLAGARYVQYSSQWQENWCMPMFPYAQIGNFLMLSEEENKDIDLAQLLLASADKIGSQQFERANSLLLQCQWSSSNAGNTVQRFVFHFSSALRERLNREIGGIALQRNSQMELIEALLMDHNSAITCHQKLPFNQVIQFVGVQAIVDHVASKTKIHLIDLALGYGLMATVLIQALAERNEKPVELLKITAVGYGSKSVLDEAGRRLVSFAKSLNLRILFKTVFVEDIRELREDDFEIESDEGVAVYSPKILRTLVSSPDSLDNLMRVIRKIKPAIMLVNEIEANHNSPLFVNRFIESLFYLSAYFDYLGTCLGRDNESRMRMEAIVSEGIRNNVSLDDKEREIRNVKIDVWRRFFARFRMVETEFSESSLYQDETAITGCRMKLPERGAEESCRARIEFGETAEGVSADGTATRRLTKLLEMWRRNSHGKTGETFRTKTQKYHNE